MGFLFLPVMPMGLRLAALRAAGAPLLLDTFAVTLHDGCRVSSLRHEHDECEELKNVASFVQKTQVSYLFKVLL